ncbi:hypothetical protein F5Y14DRAFT_65572 [Nemania sp. NC0429]|nr:hypothetical protein F5Y14DRAFT_65572 [Nemania sp. NC0429]
MLPFCAAVRTGGDRLTTSYQISRREARGKRSPRANLPGATTRNPSTTRRSPRSSSPGHSAPPGKRGEITRKDATCASGLHLHLHRGEQRQPARACAPQRTARAAAAAAAAAATTPGPRALGLAATRPVPLADRAGRAPGLVGEPARHMGPRGEGPARRVLGKGGPAERPGNLARSARQGSMSTDPGALVSHSRQTSPRLF